MPSKCTKVQFFCQYYRTWTVMERIEEKKIVQHSGCCWKSLNMVNNTFLGLKKKKTLHLVTHTKPSYKMHITYITLHISEHPFKTTVIF